MQEYFVRVKIRLLDGKSWKGEWIYTDVIRAQNAMEANESAQRQAEENQKKEVPKAEWDKIETYLEEIQKVNEWENIGLEKV